MTDRKNRFIKKLKYAEGYLFILPALLFILCFVVYPILYNIVLSLQDVTIQTYASSERPFIGLANYRTVFQNPIMMTAVKNTFFFTVVCLIFQFVLGFLLAMLFSKKFPLSGLYRGLVMVCWMIPMLVAATLGKWIFAGDTSGVVNYVLMKLHLVSRPVSWLSEPKTAMLALIITNIWKGIPFNMMLLTTGLTTLPSDIYEAAKIDGANAVQSFFKLTVPLMKPTIFSVITLGFIYTFKTFDVIYIMTGGGPLHYTENLATFSYSLTFSGFQYGQGAAVSVILFAALLVFGLIYINLINDDEVIS